LAQFIAADYFFASSLQAASQNHGQQTYENQIKALNFNPWNSNYRVSYSQTNLALANSLAGQQNLTDQQKQIVVQLVQQSLRESRLAASLQPHRAGNWENLSLIYRNLINFAQGADQWAVQTEQQAIQLDPTNPRLRLDLGGILFSAKDYQNAAQIFNQAASLKPDFANAHYNLAQALKELNITDQALQQLQLTGQLVCSPTQANPQAATSTDCKKVTSEIDDLAKKISEAAKTTTNTELKPGATQAPLASPGAEPKSNLPKARTSPPAQVGSKSGEIAPAPNL
jgi:predicted Zn-dependent protease